MVWAIGGQQTSPERVDSCDELGRFVTIAKVLVRLDPLLVVAVAVHVDYRSENRIGSDPDVVLRIGFESFEDGLNLCLYLQLLTIPQLHIRVVWELANESLERTERDGKALDFCGVQGGQERPEVELGVPYIVDEAVAELGKRGDKPPVLFAKKLKLPKDGDLPGRFVAQFQSSEDVGELRFAEVEQ